MSSAWRRSPLRATRSSSAACAAALLATGVIAACGSSSTSSSPAAPQTGAQIFASAGCGGCHTLAAAGSHGNVGPNLDDLKPSYTAALAQVTHGGGGMPAFSGQLSTSQIKRVARYVYSSTHG